MADYPPRPPTPQAMLHRLPDKPEPASSESTKPSRFIVLIVASTAVAGKAQIAKTVSTALACPLFQGDSLHETAAKAANVGAGAPMRSNWTVDSDDYGVGSGPAPSGVNETRYQRMWLSKMTRTGLLFPEESRPAYGGEFSGFGGGPSSTSTSRRGSASSDSAASDGSWFHNRAAGSSTSSLASSVMSVSYGGSGAPKYINKPLPPVATRAFEGERRRKANPALLVLTHPVLESWHKRCIRRAVGEYDIGVIFVPLQNEDSDEDEEELPVLRPLDPRTMTSFRPSGGVPGVNTVRIGTAVPAWSEEVVLRVNVEAKVEDIAEEIVKGAQDIMDAC